MIKGNFDLIENGKAHGWAMMPSSPSIKLPIEIVAGDEVIGEGIADQFRADLADNGIGDGQYSFKIILPEDLSPGIELRARVSNIDEWIDGEVVTTKKMPYKIDRKLKKLILDSGLFDEEFYKNTYPDVRKSHMSAINHFLKYGLVENRKPNKDFDPIWYQNHFSDVKLSGIYPFIHFIKFGKYENKCQNEKEYIEKQIYTVLVVNFDYEFYLMQRKDLQNSRINLVEHYIKYGWKEGTDPTPEFSVNYYLKNNHDVKESDIEPFYHWLKYGKKEGRKTSLSFYPSISYNEIEKEIAKYFDIIYYFKQYPDVKKAKINPIVHYTSSGWKEGRNPNQTFKTSCYILENPDVIFSGENPFYHFLKSTSDKNIVFSESNVIKKYLGNKIYHAMQDIIFPNTLVKAEKLFVIVVPEHNEMSGGIFSMFSIANVVKRLKSQHGYEVVLMTRPNKNDVTYCRQKNFQNAEDVFRFEQIERCTKLKELYLHLPEYTAPDFVENLQEGTLNFLKSLETLDINLLNQNFELMPKKEEFFKVRELAHNLTQSVAHHSYYGQSFADRYDLPTLLLPAYTDLSGYNPSTYENKDNLIIYSLDDAPHREAVLAKLVQELPEYELIEIRGITFDQYMDLATRCKFSISFGEGFDGYVAQAIYQGGIGVTVYNEEYFPSEEFLQYDNFFESEEDMVENIVTTIKSLDSDEKKYMKLNKALVAEWDKLYSYDDYVKQIKKLINKEFELFPGAFSQSPLAKNYKTGLSSTIVK